MNGYEICKCGKFAFIYSADVLRQLPAGYVGELCPECGLWMCAVDKLPPILGEESEEVNERQKTE